MLDSSKLPQVNLNKLSQKENADIKVVENKTVNH
jgi:hypothetical protein